MKFRKLLSAAILFFAAFFVRGVEVVNAGHSGWNSRQLREIFRQELDKNRPDLIILMVGTNDNLNSYNLVPPEEFEKNLTAMAEAARASGAELLLCEIPNACQELMQKRHKADFFRRETAEDKVRRANQIVAAVAEAQRIPPPENHRNPRESHDRRGQSHPQSGQLRQRGRRTPDSERLFPPGRRHREADQSRTMEAEAHSLHRRQHHLRRRGQRSRNRRSRRRNLSRPPRPGIERQIVPMPSTAARHGGRHRPVSEDF